MEITNVNLKNWKSLIKPSKIDVDQNDIMVTTGGSEALLFAINSCLDDGDDIIRSVTHQMRTLI